MAISIVLTKNQISFSSKKAQDIAVRGLSFLDGKKIRTWYLDFCFDMLKSNFVPEFEIVNDTLYCSKIFRNNKELDVESCKVLCSPYKIPFLEKII